MYFNVWDMISNHTPLTITKLNHQYKNKGKVKCILQLQIIT